MIKLDYKIKCQPLRDAKRVLSINPVADTSLVVKPVKGKNKLDLEV